MTQGVRNVALVSHSGAGKTSLGEALLFRTGAISRLGRVEDGTTTSDYEPEEAQRRASINLALLPVPWRQGKINLIDTPGYADFVGEVRAGLRVAEAALVVVSAAAGVEVGTEQVWDYSQGLPHIIFVNKMDRENADFFRTLSQVQARFGRSCLPLQLPVGAEAAFKGIVDLVSGKALGAEGDVVPPEGLQDKIKEYREKLVEAAAEADDALISKFLEGGELTEAEVRRGIRLGMASGKLTPVLVGSALKGIGLETLLDALWELAPSPQEGRPVVTQDPQKKGETTMEPAEAGPLAVLAFKTAADPYVGRLTYLRVFSGSLPSNSTAWNPTRNREERVAQLFQVRGKVQEPVARLAAGDIGAVARLAETATGDTLCGREHPLLLPAPEFPAPVFSLAVQPKTKADLDKMSTALNRLTEEDPTLRNHKDPDTGETILSGLGEAHLEVAAEKARRKFGSEVLLSPPRVPYRETILVGTKTEYKHKKQTGGHGQYGHVLLELEPLPRGTGREFAERVVGGSVPRNYIPAVEKGVMEGLLEGVMARFPVVDLRVTLFDGSFHAVDSSDMAFKVAASHAVRKGMSEAQPVLLEPLVNLRITVPESYMGQVVSDLNGKRARVSSMTPEDGQSVIEAQAPLAEVQRYAIDLRSITQGRGTFSMTPSHYEEVPAHIAQRVTAEREAAKA